MLDLLRQAVQSIANIFEVITDALFGLVKWIPLMAKLSASSAGFWSYVPATLLPVALCACTFYCLKVLLHGSENR